MKNYRYWTASPYMGEKVSVFRGKWFSVNKFDLLSKTSLTGKAVTLARELQNRYAGFEILLKVKMFKELWSYWANPEEDLSRENHLMSYLAHQFKSSTLS